jgi:hypothetical protein
MKTYPNARSVTSGKARRPDMSTLLVVAPTQFASQALRVVRMLPGLILIKNQIPPDLQTEVSGSDVPVSKGLSIFIHAQIRSRIVVPSSIGKESLVQFFGA